ncbi:type IV toxin-antitoxin system AbiEi family antitoxin [Salinicola halophilus]|uniref:type IV toxin-antitoxin system AbiEi family antitoxin n=1 Tax=Salinicola halophilus TaxID=184065 RepID=UPI000DA220CD|nr:type IV toxin-antitoxin system AbiEi family antitoxin [Salinicola halophilus]
MYQDEWMIMEVAVEAVRGETDLDIRNTSVDDPEGTFRVKIDEHCFEATVKKWSPFLTGKILRQMSKSSDYLLVTDYVTNGTGKKLRAQGVQYIDAAGNAYIDRSGLKVHIRGNPRPALLLENSDQKPASGAFQRKGLVVVYNLLMKPGLTGESLRTIAAKCDVAHGTVNNVMHSLKNGGFVSINRDKRRVLTHERRLMDRWVAAYGETLAPKLTIGEFWCESNEWWGDSEVVDYQGAWGGEIAGKFYSHYLQPEVATLYLPRARYGEVMRRYRLRKAPPGHQPNVRLLEKFWSDEERERGYVSPLLAYADLINTADPRNAETARMIDERYLADDFDAD